MADFVGHRSVGHRSVAFAVEERQGRSKQEKNREKKKKKKKTTGETRSNTDVIRKEVAQGGRGG